MDTCSVCGQTSFLPMADDHHTLPSPTCWVCVGDYDTFHVQCEECGDYFHVEESSSDESLSQYCPDCQEKILTCEDCGETFFPHRHYHQIGGDDFCPGCVNDHGECDECGNSYHVDNASYTNDGENSYCSSRCYSRNWSYCSDCSAEFPAGEYCPNGCGCEEEEEESPSRNIRPYSTKPAWKKFGTGPFAGIEIECECEQSTDNDYHAGRSASILGDSCAVVKEDGSISTSRGFEIVTHPHSLERWSSVPLQELCSYLTEKKYRSHDTSSCGLHVHVSRSHLDTPALCRLAVFVHSQRNNLEKIGRRSFNSYCKYKETIEDGLDLVRDYDRYGAINFCPSQTVEFRFPKGSLNPSTILGTIQVCFAITAFCAEHISSRELQDTSSTWEAFLSFLRSSPDYPAAVSYLEKRGF